MDDEDRTAEATPAPAISSQKDVVKVWLSYAPGERIAGKYQLVRLLGAAWARRAVALKSP